MVLAPPPNPESFVTAGFLMRQWGRSLRVTAPPTGFVFPCLNIYAKYEE